MDSITSKSATGHLTMESKKVISADGTEIYADAIGNPSSPALVFIHGFSMSGLAFDAIFDDPEWSNDVYLVRYDMRGHGRSGKPVDEAAWESKRLCEDFEAVVHAFSLSKPFVVGWSLGATNITDILSFHPPSYLSGVIYMCALPYMGLVMGKVGLPHILQALPPLMQTNDVPAFQSSATVFVDSLSSLLHTPRFHATYLSYLGHFMVQPRDVTARLLARTQNEEGLLNAGRSGELPLLAVNGKKDNVVNGVESVNAIDGWKDLRVVELEEGDHLPWLSAKMELRDAVLGWVKRVNNH